jgi:hypothetical protein
MGKGRKRNVGPEQARCEYESLAANVVESDARVRVFQQRFNARKALVVTESFLVYFFVRAGHSARARSAPTGLDQLSVIALLEKDKI